MYPVAQNYTQRIQTLYSDCEREERILGLYPRLINNTIVLELHDAESVNALYSLALNFLEMNQIWGLLCNYDRDAFNTKKLAIKLRDPTYKNVWQKIQGVADILSFRVLQAVGLEMCIRRESGPGSSPEIQLHEIKKAANLAHAYIRTQKAINGTYY